MERDFAFTRRCMASIGGRLSQLRQDVDLLRTEEEFQRPH